MDYKVENVVIRYEGGEISERLSSQQKLVHDIIISGQEEEYLQKDPQDGYKNGYMLQALTPIRQNLLEWIDFEPDAAVLELGGGTGILTELLCRRAGRVTSVVTNVGDAYINAVRSRMCQHLRIVVPEGDWQEAGGWQEAYDEVVLVGADTGLYCGLFGESDSPPAAEAYAGLLDFSHQCLKEKGRLILAVNNRLGLQYWAGQTDDCSPEIGDAMMGEEDGQKEFCFSKRRLSALLQEAGFEDIRYYYPVPDYRYAEQIFSDTHLPGVGSVRPASAHYDRERYQFFDEKKVYDTLCEDGCFDVFANSYLVQCTK